MNILVITPLYYIQDRPELVHDSNAIHYLIRPWAKDHNVVVINVYLQSIFSIGRYISREARILRNGYFYNADSVRVAMIEVQKLPKQGPVVLEHQAQRVADFITNYLSDLNFIPQLIVSHIPISTARVVNRIYPFVPKVAVLHNTDMLYCYKKKKDTDLVVRLYERLFARSGAILDFYQNKLGVQVDDNIIFSGVPQNLNVVTRKDNEQIRFIYAGKLISLKNVDITIKAIANIRSRTKKDFVFSVYGEGRQKRKLLKIAKAFNVMDICSFHDFISRDELLKEFAGSDFLIMVSSPETLGLVYLEAMMQGCIPIGSRGEGIDGIIKDGENGFLVEPRNVSDLEKIVLHCLNMTKTEKSRISNNMEKTMELFGESDRGLFYYEHVCKPFQRKM